MMALCNSTHVREGISLAGLMYTDVNVLNLRKSAFEIQEMENYFPRITGEINWIAIFDSRAAWTFATSTREFSDTLEATFVNSTRDCYQTCINEFCESIKKGLMFDYIPVYGCSAPAKSGAGRRNPVFSMATQTPKASFFVSCHRAHQIRGSIRNVSMVALAGQPSGWPVFIEAGIPTPVNVTTLLERRNSGGDSKNSMEAATWLLPPPKNRNLSGLSLLFAATCRQLKPKSITSPHILNAMPAALWFGITSAFSLVASVWRWLMRNYFRITGYAVNKRGLTIGIGYDITSSDTKAAKAHAMLQAQRDGLIHIRVLRVQEVAA